MSSDKISSLVVVGSVALDTIEAGPPTKRETRQDVLGGSASFFSVAASYFAPVKLVAVVGEDFPREHTDLFAKKGVALDGLERAKGKTFRWSGRYSDDLSSRTTLDTQLNVFAEFNPKLPSAWQSPDLLFLGNILPTLQLSVLEQVKKPKLIAMDTMNLWIDTARKDLGHVLSKIDLLFVNDEEARQISGEHNLSLAAKAIIKQGPKTVIVKRGDSGALLFHEDKVFAAPAYPLETVSDPTGAGDTFAGGFMGYLAKVGNLSAESIRRAMYYGSVMASFSVEAFSLDRLQDLKHEEIEARYRAFIGLTHFETLKPL